MKISQLCRNVASIWLGAAMLAGCFQTQPPLTATGATVHGPHAGGKMLEYLYVSDQRAGEVEVFANDSYQPERSSCRLEA